MNKKLVIIYVFVIILFGSAIGLTNYYITEISKSPAKTMVPDTKIKVKTPPRSETSTKTKQIAPTAVLVVPYAAQAPFSNWTVHEESCEEAALTMYRNFFEGLGDVTLEDGPIDLTYREMKTWEVSHYGKEPDLTMEALGKFASDYYGYKYATSEATDTNIKQAITDGKPVIVPVMTHSLENSMYGPHSVYHVLLIKGYDTTGVITNDAGVGNGKSHHYDWDILWQAIDAQTPKMGQGRVMLTLSK